MSSKANQIQSGTNKTSQNISQKKKNSLVNWIEAPQQQESQKQNSEEFSHLKVHPQTKQVGNDLIPENKDLAKTKKEEQNEFNPMGNVLKLQQSPSSKQQNNSSSSFSPNPNEGFEEQQKSQFINQIHSQSRFIQQKQFQGENLSAENNQGTPENNAGYHYLSYVRSEEEGTNQRNRAYQSNMVGHSQMQVDNEKEGKQSKVLLVAVQNPKDEVIEHKIIFNKFSDFGNVEQILIFSKKQQWKFFVDMDSLDSAVRARQVLDGTNLFVSGKELKMRVSYSNQQELYLKNGNPGGINYKELNSKLKNTQLSYSRPVENSSYRQSGSQSLISQKQQNQQALESLNSRVSTGSAHFQEGSFPFEGLNNHNQNEEEQEDSYHRAFEISKNFKTQNGITSKSAQVPIQAIKGQFYSVNLANSPSLGSNFVPIIDHIQNNKERIEEVSENSDFRNEIRILTQHKEEANQNEIQSTYSFGQKGSKESSGQVFNFQVEKNLSSKVPSQSIDRFKNFQQETNISEQIIQKDQTPVIHFGQRESLTEQLDDILQLINQRPQGSSGEISQEAEYEGEYENNKKVEDNKAYQQKYNVSGEVNSKKEVGNNFNLENKDNSPMKGLKKLDELIGSFQGLNDSFAVSDEDDQVEEKWTDQKQVKNSQNQIGSLSQEREGYNAFFQYQNSSGVFSQQSNSMASEFSSKSASQNLANQKNIQQAQFYQPQSKSANLLQNSNQKTTQSTFKFAQLNDNLSTPFSQMKPEDKVGNRQFNNQHLQFNEGRFINDSDKLSNHQPYNNSVYQQIQQQNNGGAHRSASYQIPQYSSSQTSQTNSGPSQQFSSTVFGNQSNVVGHKSSSSSVNTGVIQENMGIFHGSTYVKQGFLEDSRPSKVIYVNHLLNPEIQLLHLYNVFSNFGDISKIVFKRAKGTSFIEYTTQEFSTRAKDCMDKKMFFENEVRVFYSHFETLFGQQEDKQAEQYVGSEATFRFLKDSKMTLNAPSYVIHISNLKQEVCDHEKMNELFRQFGKIDAIHIEKIPPRYMCHIKFSQIKESLMAVAYMHNKEVKGRKMFISFTRKKLDQSNNIKNLVIYSKPTAQSCNLNLE